MSAASGIRARAPPPRSPRTDTINRCFCQAEDRHRDACPPNVRDARRHPVNRHPMSRQDDDADLDLLAVRVAEAIDEARRLIELNRHLIETRRELARERWRIITAGK